MKTIDWIFGLTILGLVCIELIFGTWLWGDPLSHLNIIRAQTKPQLGASMPVVEALYQIKPGTFAVACCETRICCLDKPSSDKQPI